MLTGDKSWIEANCTALPKSSNQRSNQSDRVKRLMSKCNAGHQEKVMTFREGWTGYLNGKRRQEEEEKEEKGEGQSEDEEESKRGLRRKKGRGEGREKRWGRGGGEEKEKEAPVSRFFASLFPVSYALRAQPAPLLSILTRTQ